MTTTDANGLVVFSGTDLVAPLHSSVLNVMTAGISAAITNLNAPATITTFASSGTWTKPARLVAIHVRLVGGGGAGGGAVATTSTQVSCGGGGGGGAYSECWFAASSLPSTVSVVVGTGGVGAAGAVGGDGLDTSFGTFLTAGGGGGGQISAATTTATNVGGGSGGAAGTATTPSGGTLRLGGGNGTRGFAFAAGVVALPGMGAYTQLGAGQTNVGQNGATPVTPGAGGGGGGGSANTFSQAARTGGNGGGGVVIIEHFYGNV